MQCFETLAGLNLRSSAVAIGALDGIHLGHKRLLERTWLYAGLWNIPSVVLTFDPLPSIFLGRTAADENLLLSQERSEMLEYLGIDKLVILPFTQELAELSAKDFMTQLQQALHIKTLFCGEDFSLGRNCEGSTGRLAELGAQLHYHLEVIPKLELKGAAVSSTRIRALLKAGCVREANDLLGYEYYFTNKVIHGEARGRRLGFPTINMRFPEGKLQLGRGVYVATLALEGRSFPSVTNVGVRPTFHPGDEDVVVESYLLEGGDDFYGDMAEISFVEKLRDEVVFTSAEELVTQISRDVEKARKILA